jgi:16S rRNA (uracil1498-N3)-methyltransferase
MSDRFFVAELIAAERVLLAGDEARHLIHVLRAKPGQTVMLFDGSGAEFKARVERVGRSEAALTIEGRTFVDRELTFELTLAVALPKGDRQRWLVEKLVELGVTRLVPLITERGVAEPVDHALARLRGKVIEASKQCGRNRLMEISAPRRWITWCAEGGAVGVADPSRRRAVADPSGSIDARRWWSESMWSESLHRGAVLRSAVLAVGPEGGWTEAELRTAKLQGWECLVLGPRILRVETAAVALAAIVA